MNVAMVKLIGSKGRLGCGPTSSLEEGIEKRKQEKGA
jgi:hypothetical protein